MNEVELAAFFDELEKVAAKGQKRMSTYRAGIAAHELGHAKDYEGSKIPRLRGVGRSLAPVAGLAGGALLTRSGRPGLGAVAAGAGQLPTLADEFLASYHGMNALKESKQFDKKQLRRMRNDLMLAGGTYLTRAAASVGQAVALGASDERTANHAKALIYGGGAANLGAIGGMVARIKKHPASEKKDLEKLRSAMGVKGQIYQARDKPGQWARTKELGAFYAPKPTGKISRAIMKWQIAPHVNKKDMKKILSEGGVVLPKAAQ